MSTISKKICMIGDFGVGKTSLIRRFVDREFSDQYLSTVGVKISRKPLQVEKEIGAEPIGMQLLIWDLEGHTKFKAIAPSYLQGSGGALIVADVTRTETIERVAEHIKLFASVNPKGSLMIALNKADLVEPEKIPKLQELCQDIVSQISPGSELVLGIYSTSARTGEFVDDIFQKLAIKTLVKT
ncbi:Rab family GTPase [Oscillatoria acuminata]|uniref:Small GTP-binding protein domain protein n=1 Tax=Oscillatoria acuminata PCC 6304 TaxID=56110 RepID=K9TI55_9CYAN|nr:Rab family GTPase [Oscillatoria acuminata]AFY82215.1 small GTP-binding protein domain protein [Oscillatoria acuminata PCC 6304]